MKIRHPADQPTPVALTNGPAATGSAAAPSMAASPSPVSAGPSAKVALSSTASTLRSSPASAEFDAEKVARIAKAIDDGTFKVNPQAIADKLISNAQELLGRVPS